MVKTTFDEQSMIDLIESEILSGFENDDENDWDEILGGNSMVVANETYGTQTYFPCFHVEIVNPVQYADSSDSSQNERFTVFDFEIQMFNQATSLYSARTLGLMINKKTKLILQEAFDFKLNSNSSAPNADQTIYRRILAGRVVYDNIYETFYNK